MADMTLEEALAAADVSTTPVNDILMVDAEARTIIVPASEMLFGVRQDMDAERKHFKCPKIVGDNIDLSQCHIYISYVPSKQDGTYDINDDVGGYWCEDLAVDGDYITFSWKLSGNVFVKAGYIAFAVYAKQEDADGNMQTKWHTTFAIGKVLDTLPDGEQIAEKYADVIEQLLNRMDEVEALATPEAMQNYAEAYLAEHPAELDETLTDNTKAAPAGMVGELKGDLSDITEQLSESITEIKNQTYGETIESTNLYSTDMPEVKLTVNVNTRAIATSSALTGVIIPIDSSKGNVITVEKVSSQRFICGTTTEVPAPTVPTVQSKLDGEVSRTKWQINITEAEKYLLVVYYYSDDTISKEDIQNSIRVYYGEEWIEPTIIEGDIPRIKEIIEESVLSLDKTNVWKLLNERKLGVLSKGYICLTCDDGASSLATYTIPMLKAKGVPCTFGLMSTSQVVNDDTYLQTVQEMLTDTYKCDVALHGNTSYTEYSTENLVKFLNDEKAILESKSLMPKGIIYPNHEYDDKVLAVCGSYYGVCCTGGTKKPVYYSGYGAGSRSNMYSLYRFSVVSATIEQMETYIDKAIANSHILLPFWHDNSVANNTEYQQKLEAMIDYAKEKGITFCTIGDIPTLL